MNDPLGADVPIRVAGIAGSIRPGSYTRSAVVHALRGAADAGAETELVDLRQYQLPFCDGGENEAAYPKDVFRLRDQIKRADGIILGTPEYHSHFSGVLKNALDLMGFDEFEGKMIGLVGVSGGRQGAIEALHALRNVGRALHAWVVPEEAGVAEAWNAFDEAGNLKDPQLAQRLRLVGRQVAEFARLHKCGRAHDFLQSWETAPVNPGGA